MTKIYNLEEFYGHEVGKPITHAGLNDATVLAADLEQIKTEAFENGYRAGWDDAGISHAEDQKQIGAVFSQNLQDLGFTFHEARVHVMNSLQPLLKSMVEKVLPSIAAETFGQRVLEVLQPLIESATDVSIEIVVSPKNMPAMEHLLAGNPAMPVTLNTEESLGDSQVLVRAGPAEERIDLDTTIQEIGDAIAALAEINAKEVKYA